MLSVNHHLGNSYVLYWTPCESLINFTLKKKKHCEKGSCLVRGCSAVALSTAAIIACSTNNTEKAW